MACGGGGSRDEVMDRSVRTTGEIGRGQAGGGGGSGSRSEAGQLSGAHQGLDIQHHLPGFEDAHTTMVVQQGRSWACSALTHGRLAVMRGIQRIRLGQCGLQWPASGAARAICRTAAHGAGPPWLQQVGPPRLQWGQGVASSLSMGRQPDLSAAAARISAAHRGRARPAAPTAPRPGHKCRTASGGVRRAPAGASAFH